MIVAYNETGAFLSDKIGVISPDFKNHNGVSPAAASKWCIWYDEDLETQENYQKAVDYEQSKT